jgi:hypothetical protein
MEAKKIVLLLTICVSSCMTSGKPMDAEVYANVKTTKSDGSGQSIASIQGKYGRPLSITPMKNKNYNIYKYQEKFYGPNMRVIIYVRNYFFVVDDKGTIVYKCTADKERPFEADVYDSEYIENNVYLP